MEIHIDTALEQITNSCQSIAHIELRSETTKGMDPRPMIIKVGMLYLDILLALSGLSIFALVSGPFDRPNS